MHLRVAAIGARKESGWVEIREARGDRCRRSASNGAESATAKRLMADRALQHGRASRRRSYRDRNRRDAGAARQPRGPAQGPREPDGVPREARPGLPGRMVTGPRVAERRPRTRRTSRHPLAARKKRRVPTGTKRGFRDGARAGRIPDRLGHGLRPRPRRPGTQVGAGGRGCRSKACASGPLRDDGRTHDAAEWRNDLPDTEGCDRRGPRRHHHHEPARGAQRHEHGA